jgi:hypothetical protein
MWQNGQQQGTRSKQWQTHTERRSPIEVEHLQLLEVLQLDAVDLLKEDVACGGRHLVQRAHVDKLLHTKQNEQCRRSIARRSRKGTDGGANLRPDQGIVSMRRVLRLDVERAKVGLLLVLRLASSWPAGMPPAAYVGIFFGCATTSSMAQCPMQHRKIMARSYETHRLGLVGTDLTRLALRGHRSEIDGDIGSRRLCTARGRRVRSFAFLRGRLSGLELRFTVALKGIKKG